MWEMVELPHYSIELLFQDIRLESCNRNVIDIFMFMKYFLLFSSLWNKFFVIHMSRAVYSIFYWINIWKLTCHVHDMEYACQRVYISVVKQREKREWSRT